MRRENRMAGKENTKRVWYTWGSAILLAVLAFIVVYLLYGNRPEEIESPSGLGLAYTTNTLEGNSQITSTSIGKSIHEIENTIETNQENGLTTTNEVEDTTAPAQEVEAPAVEEQEPEQEPEITPTATEPTETEEITLQFMKPVEGKVQTVFAKEKLVYSETLKEWIMHNGIDIQAEKTTVVKATEQGTVTAIKNDPRYGITVVIEHANGFQSIYANLLTAEFVQQGETVEKGQTIGTVGNTATFEIADPPHLHFEMLQNGNYVDPELWITE